MISEDWVAGFFDGEGCIWFGKQTKNTKLYPCFKIILSQSGEDGLELLKAIQKEYGGILYQHLKVGQHKAKKPAYKLYWNKEVGIIFLNRIKDKLILKKQQAIEVLSWIER